MKNWRQIELHSSYYLLVVENGITKDNTKSAVNTIMAIYVCNCRLFINKLQPYIVHMATVVCVAFYLSSLHLFRKVGCQCRLVYTGQQDDKYERNVSFYHHSALTWGKGGGFFESKQKSCKLFSTHRVSLEVTHSDMILTKNSDSFVVSSVLQHFPTQRCVCV